MTIVPVFEADFDNSPRHCWYSARDQVWIRESDHATPCTTWGQHPDTRGKVAWLRFIHAFGDQVPKNSNPFVSESNFPPIAFEQDAVTRNGRHSYAERYDGRDGRPMFRVFINNQQHWASIECYEEALKAACEQAFFAVRQSYADEEEA